MRLRYVGSLPTSFMTLDVGSLQPGEEFLVTDEEAPSFLARTDIELVVVPEPVEEPTPTRAPTRERKQAAAPAAPDPVTDQSGQ